mgnify:CR=1 FL=1
MKRFLIICLGLFLIVSCDEMADHTFDESSDFDTEELEKIGKHLAKALKDKNSESFYRYFDRELFKIYSNDLLDNDLTNSYESSGVDNFVQNSIEWIFDVDGNNRKYELINVFEEEGRAVLVIAATTITATTFYELHVTNFNNSYRVYDIYYPAMGFTLSDRLIVNYSYDWNNLSYLDEGAIWSIESDYQSGKYAEVIEEAEALQTESKNNPWVMGIYINARFGDNKLEDLGDVIHKMKGNADLLKFSLYRSIPEPDSMRFYIDKLSSRYGQNPIISNYQNEVLYHEGNPELAEKRFKNTLLTHNDLAHPYEFLGFISANKGDYKKAVKFIKILQRKFEYSASTIRTMFSYNESFTDSREYKNWMANESFEFESMSEAEVQEY